MAQKTAILRIDIHVTYDSAEVLQNAILIMRTALEQMTETELERRMLEEAQGSTPLTRTYLQLAQRWVEMPQKMRVIQ